MDENRYDSNQQYNNGYGQQYNNGYDQQYGSQQFNNGYNSTQQVNLPEGVASILPESWKNGIEDKLTEAAQRAQNPYEQIVARERRAFIRPMFAVIAMLILFAGCFPMKQGNAALFVFSFGITCILIGLGIITDQRNSFKRHTKSCVWVIFGVEVILASGYQMLAGSNPSLQPMNGRALGMAFGIIIGSIGPLLLIFHFLNYYFQKKICSYEVQAVCAYLQQRWAKGSKGSSYIVYIPIYEFTFRGNVCRVAGVGRNYKVPMVGVHYDLMINPNDPADFYSKKDGYSVSVWILAFVSIAIGFLLFNSTIG
ncbi:MAG: hypothetical protein K2K96_10085 [Lachnospiraceae bacterium]|nr:hypothetical protein [Lachnospiraceae bacterium]